MYRAASDVEQPKLMDFDEWKTLGERLFGADRDEWMFVCPSCGNVQTPAEMKALGENGRMALCCCIGRYDGHIEVPICSGQSPCNYAGYGLFHLETKRVEGAEGVFRVFAFAVEDSDEEPVADV